MLDLTQLIEIDVDRHQAMAWLGKQKWLTLENDGPSVVIKTHFDDLTKLPGARDHLWTLRGLIRLIEDSCYCNNKTLTAQGWNILTTDAIAAVLSEGPKVFVPTEEQFESMRHVSVDFPVTEYHQCYPALVIEYPPLGRRQLATEFGLSLGEAPRAAVVRHRREDSVLFVHQCPHPNKHSRTISLLCSAGGGAIETSLTRPDEHSGSPLNLYSEAAGRVAINCALFLTHFGCTVTGPLCPRDYERHRRKKHLEKFSYSDAVGLALNRHVVARKEVRVRREHQGGGGWEMPPGWRRGHWRRPPNTPADSPKTVLVNPAFVRPDRLEGDPGDTFTTYEAL